MKSKSAFTRPGTPKPRTNHSRAMRDGVEHDLYFKILAVLLQESTATIPSSLTALGYLRSRDYMRLYRWAEGLSEVSYKSVTTHFVANQLCSLIKKYPWPSKWVPELDPRKAALDKFDESEEHCRITNRRFNRKDSLLRSRFYPLLEDMRRFISSVLGHKPDMGEVYRSCAHGTGASIGVHGNATNLHRKLSVESYSVTPSAVSLAFAALWTQPHLRELFCRKGEESVICLDVRRFTDTIGKRITLTRSNKLSFVPKTAKTHRAIAIEPLLNTYVQSGIDTVMRRKLSHVGLFLNYQGHNQELARLGSETGAYSTIDLSSASDTVATNVVHYLLPPSWFWLLSVTRSPSYSYKEQRRVDVNYEKFSSMGNNFTFPLESLIFYAAARAVMRAKGVWGHESIAVYGDDIVVPSTCYKLMIPFLKFLGFLPNPSKCFEEGPFRESCGSDWYRGQDVRPVELDYTLVNTSTKMIFHNACLRSSLTAAFFSSVLPLLRDSVPDQERFMRPSFGRTNPQGYSTSLLDLANLNGAFTVPLDVAMTSRHARWSRREQRWTWKEFLFQAVDDNEWNRSSFPPQGNELISYLAFLRGQPLGSPTLRYSAKRRVVVR